MIEVVTAWCRDVVHNCLVHPLLPFLPTAWGDQLHDANGRWAYPDGRGGR